jgi:hypothetical protein
VKEKVKLTIIVRVTLRGRKNSSSAWVESECRHVTLQTTLVANDRPNVGDRLEFYEQGPDNILHFGMVALVLWKLQAGVLHPIVYLESKMKDGNLPEETARTIDQVAVEFNQELVAHESEVSWKFI